ncbi:MAG: DUF6399 domain-containing protein [Candidatus Tectimicrobiota bacterium]
MLRFEPGGAWAALSPACQAQLRHQAKTLAEVFQRSSANVEGRHGDLSLRNHQRRGLERPRKRTCLTTVHNFFLTRPDGTTAAERFFGQKPRSLFAVILEAVELPPAPLSPSRRPSSGPSRDRGHQGRVVGVGALGEVGLRPEELEGVCLARIVRGRRPLMCFALRF